MENQDLFILSLCDFNMEEKNIVFGPQAHADTHTHTRTHPQNSQVCLNMDAIQPFLRSLACVLTVTIRWLPLLVMVEWWYSTLMLGPCHLVWFQRSRHAQTQWRHFGDVNKNAVLGVLRVNPNWIQGLTPLTSLKKTSNVFLCSGLSRMLRLATQSAKLFGATRMQKAAVWLLQFCCGFLFQIKAQNIYIYITFFSASKCSDLIF